MFPLMKKFYTLILSVLLVSGSFHVLAQVPNMGFEVWNNALLYQQPLPFVTTNPQVYFSTLQPNVKPVTGHSGNYAARLETVPAGIDTIPGAIILGSFGFNGIIGGYPYTGQPDSIRGWFRYNIPVGDTALLFIILKKNTLPISLNMIPITGSLPNFTELTFPITYPILPPDTIQLVITSGNFDSPIPGGWLEVDDLTMLNTTEQLPNNGFENWTDFAIEDPQGWFTLNIFSAMFGQPPSVVKTTDAYNGSYAVSMTSVPFMFGDTLSFLTNGMFGPNGPAGGSPFPDRPAKLTGYYKYTPVGNDSALAFVRFTKWNLGTGMADSVGGGLIALGPASVYTKFEVPIGYALPDNPDTTLIIFSSSNLLGNEPVGLGSNLLLDDLAFEFPTGETVPLDLALTKPYVYPNPAGEIAYIRAPMNPDSKVNLHLFNVIGEELTQQVRVQYDRNNNIIVLNTNRLKRGIYIWTLDVDGKQYTGRLTIQ